MRSKVSKHIWCFFVAFRKIKISSATVLCTEKKKRQFLGIQRSHHYVEENLALPELSSGGFHSRVKLILNSRGLRLPA